MTARGEAAWRLPPLECGCRDPESRAHLGGRCRFAAGQLAEPTPAARRGREMTLEHFRAFGYDLSWTAPTWVQR